MEPIELTELMELRKNILIKHGAQGAYRAYRAKKEYAYWALSIKYGAYRAYKAEKEYTY